MPTQRPMQDDYDETAMFGGLANSPPPMPRQASPVGNPLSRYFRQPGLHVQLPTGGAFMPPGTIKLTVKGDLPILPMSAADELLLKSPDALMSGYAIEQLIISCVPDIKAPLEVSQPDLDVLLLAIRAATYGETMPVGAVCPKCKTENSFDCHLPSLMATMRPIPPENPVRLTDEVVVYVRPMNVENAGKIGIASFEETRKAQALDDDKTIKPDVMQRALNDSYKRLSLLRVEMTADCIVKIVIPDGEVVDRASIREFLANISQAWVKQIEAKQAEINSLGMDKRIDCTCSKCKHEWQTTLEFDPASFFG